MTSEQTRDRQRCPEDGWVAPVTARPPASPAVAVPLISRQLWKDAAASACSRASVSSCFSCHAAFENAGCSCCPYPLKNWSLTSRKRRLPSVLRRTSLGVGGAPPRDGSGSTLNQVFKSSCLSPIDRAQLTQSRRMLPTHSFS